MFQRTTMPYAAKVFENAALLVAAVVPQLSGLLTTIIGIIE